MPPKKTGTTSPYFKTTPRRTSTRVSNASASKKRQTFSSDSEFDVGNSSESDFGETRKSASKNKRQKVEESSDADDISEEESENGDDSDDESKPPKTVIIPLPKAREEGDVPYEDGRIHENTMLFLKDLKANNDREWLRFNDEDFRNSQKDFASFVEELSPLVSEKDVTIPELPVKDIIFRIYRDVRFSNDKTPYKPHFSVAWSRTGRKGAYAAYYLHIQPGHSFIGGGLWNPEAASLERLRDDIDQNPQLLKQALMTPNLRRDFFSGAKKEENVIDAFSKMNAGNALKTKPRGYEVDHQDIKLLRLRNFTINKKLQDSEITNENTLEMIANIIESMVPFITYLNSVVRPDRRTQAAPPAIAAPTAADSSDNGEDNDNDSGDE